jgi:selenide,water dikinase
MQPHNNPILRDLVLVGGGHSHVGVLKAFAMRPLPGVRITLVCTDAHTPYSGMLPGYVAGHYDFDAVHLDLVRLCVFAGARFVRGEVTGIDRARRQVLLRDRPALDYDLLAINTGSTPQNAATPGAAAHAVSVKPIASFNQRWLALLDAVRAGHGPRAIAVVGAGAGGVELLLAMQHRLRAECQALSAPHLVPEFALFSASDTILPTHNARVQHRFAQVLRARGVQVHTGVRVTQVSEAAVQIHRTGEPPGATGEWLCADAVFWVTQAGGGAWLQGTGLALDGAGCVRVNSFLQSLTDPRIFASGDVASMDGGPLEKAGVFAVRMAMPLARNLRHALLGQGLRAYRPQRRWLALITTGDRYAVASRGALSFAGAWVWRWKDGIDRRFMQRFSDLGAPPMARASAARAPLLTDLSAEESQQSTAAQAMRCGGCGAKVGAGVLAQALGALRPLPNSDVLIGLAAPDDAALVRVPPGKAVVQTVDFFRAFVDDPYRFGQIAANHALGDIFAMGAQAHTAMAVATVPPGVDRQTRALLGQMMTGAVEVLNAAGCSLVGGHTGEGQELALGFAINGLVELDAQGQPVGVLHKGGMQPGDLLILTKPLGTGTLFAAHALGLARGRWVEAALVQMAQSSQGAARTLQAFGASACTDVTGFGLLGHLLEMARASQVELELRLAALPVLDGALECLARGITSSLHSANARQSVEVSEIQPLTQDRDWALRQALLYDPQTAGGLLASVAAAQAHACVAALRAQGYAHSAIIGRVQSPLTGTKVRGTSLDESSIALPQSGARRATVWLVEQ